MFSTIAFAVMIWPSTVVGSGAGSVVAAGCCSGSTGTVGVGIGSVGVAICFCSVAAAVGVGVALSPHAVNARSMDSTASRAKTLGLIGLFFLAL